eukprot:CAMPEP_0185778080 /NCGR_PEP_ID=MMETSP1174-20130828/91503_1 /TAXON_ID=35687 /ORGANISM="Dictyocha speculum, Strain CCMP1381" /LENGTH=126 /DNA_ID=CAMNT_0028466675 /DNA_START=9 /DNA_END=385 /DNA_ORIENTATION=-
MRISEATEVLGVELEGLTETELTKSYRKLSLLHHPDKNPGDEGATARFQRISAAFERLSRHLRREQPRGCRVHGSEDGSEEYSDEEDYMTQEDFEEMFEEFAAHLFASRAYAGTGGRGASFGFGGG